LEHGLSGVVPNLEHGAGLAIIGPELFKLLYRAKPQEAWEAMRALDPTLRPNKEDAERAGESILKFQRSVGFSLTLSEYGFNDRKLREAIDVAWPLFQSRLMPELPEIGKEEIFSILKALL
jgi:alcohol dehydrogenase YqhD (iron-dependent ADH family)